MGSAVDPRLQETLTLISSDKVEGTAVRRPNGDKVGEIARLMIDKQSGRIAFAVMSFGGFLGLGAGFYPIPWEKLNYNPGLDAYEIDIDENQLSAAPKFTDEAAFDWSSAEGRRVKDYYGVPSVT